MTFSADLEPGASDIPLPRIQGGGTSELSHPAMSSTGYIYITSRCVSYTDRGGGSLPSKFLLTEPHVVDPLVR